MSRFVVGLGSNLGSRAAFLSAALDLLGDTPGVRLVEASPVYETEALADLGPPFLNAAALLVTDRPAHDLLERLMEVERWLGRVREGRWLPRTLDLDLLWGSEPVDDPPRLRVPHPALAERPFALAPLLDVAPELEAEYGPALRRAGGRPTRVHDLQDAGSHDAWDRMAAELTRSARRNGEPAGAAPGGLVVRSRAVPPPGLPGRLGAVGGWVREQARGALQVRRVALGPGPGGGSTAYLVGAPAANKSRNDL
ncbi:MAG: 2-amino-4-hydroxy-6-hydroxymethyldihydropteridine diphosphokinase [Myxococcota bacterium]